MTGKSRHKRRHGARVGATPQVHQEGREGEDDPSFPSWFLRSRNVHDLGSRTGTYVNGNKIAAPTLIGPGDHIKIGEEDLTALLASAAAVPPPVAAAEARPAEAVAPVAEPAVSQPQSKEAPPAPPQSPKRGGAAAAPRRWIYVAGGIVLLAIVGLAIVLLSGGGSSTLTPAQIIAKDKPATVMVFSRGTGAISGLNNGNELMSGGSGWVYDASRGLVVTNAHVVVNGATVQAGYDSSSLTDATIVGVDLGNDIAVLKVPPAVLTGLKTMSRANPASIKQGDAAYALGYPGNSSTSTDFLKTSFQLTQGAISATTGVRANVSYSLIPKNDRGTVILPDLYQTDAAINPGNSGGPLVNNKGELVGMVVAGSGAAQSQGYAIPVSKVNSIVPGLAQGNSIGWPGCGASAVPSVAAQAWGGGGLIVTSVAKDTSADQIGLGKLMTTAANTNEGHFILVDKVDGQTVETQQAWIDALKAKQSGQKVVYHMWIMGADGKYSSSGDKTIAMP